MARRRSYARRAVSTVRRAGRRVYAGVRRGIRRRSYGSSGMGMDLMGIGVAFGYGYARGMIVSQPSVQQFMASIPFGGAYKDNLVLGGGAFLINLLLKPTMPLVKMALREVIHAEAFIAGAKAQAGQPLTGLSANASYNGIMLN